MRCLVCDYVPPVPEDPCAACGTWGSCASGDPSREVSITSAGRSVRLSNVKHATVRKLSTGLTEWDKAMTGGFRMPSVVMLAGDPGIGKTTMALHLASRMASVFSLEAIALSAEMGVERLQETARRAKADLGKLWAFHSIGIGESLAEAKARRARFVIADSLQEFLPEGGGNPGTPTSITAVLAKIRAYVYGDARRPAIALVLSRLNKQNLFDGPESAAHQVDTILYLTPEMLFCQKNRDGVAPMRALPETIGLT